LIASPFQDVLIKKVDLLSKKVVKVIDRQFNNSFHHYFALCCSSIICNTNIYNISHWW